MSAEVVAGLVSPPVSIADAIDQLPERPGFYAWWVQPGDLPDVPTTRHEAAAPYELLYVGIAPSRATSRSTLRRRVVGNHIRGNIASSTFRLSLAALLFEREGWQPLARRTKVALSADHDRALRSWQEQHLRLTWFVVEEPRSHEAEVIEGLRPPLNLAENRNHPFHEEMTSARARFRASARPR